MMLFFAYHVRMLARFCVSNKIIVSIAIISIALLPFSSYWFLASTAARTGLAITRADIFISTLSAAQPIEVGWSLVPLVALVIASLVFHRFYTDNFTLRWRDLRRVQAGRVFDALIITLAIGLILFIAVLCLSAFLDLGTTNFAYVHSLFSQTTKQVLSQEPDQIPFLAIMLLYVLLGVSLIGQLFLLIRKVIKSDAATIALLTIIGLYHLYDTKYVLALFNLPMSLISLIPNPLALVYSPGDIGYASWLVLSAHGLPIMAIVLAVLFALNVLMPDRLRTLICA